MEKLNFLLAQWAHLPPQGSDAWLAARRTRIGGSEIASAIGQSPYEKPADYVAKKRSAHRFTAAACTFGRVMEPVAKRIIEGLLDTVVHELGAVPSTRFPMCYSPDGLLLLNDELKLLEIKCPFRRSRLVEVPKHYLCQVQSGMNILPCESTLFYQFRFRSCRIEDMGTSVKYNRWMHTESYKRCPKIKPLRWGYLHWEADSDLIDLGALGKEDTHNLCVVDRLGTATQHWETTELPDEGYILPWKLFDYTTVDVPRDPDFLERHADRLWDIHRQLLPDE